MTAEIDQINNQIDELLGSEPTISETPEPEITQASEADLLVPGEVKPEHTANENKQTPEQIAENYKRMAHAERMERKQISQQMQVMQQRFEQLMSALPKKEATPEPIYEDDPLGATFNKVDKVVQSVEQLKLEAAQRQQVDQYQGFVANVKNDEAMFMQQAPDYKDAITFIQQRRLQELHAMGYPEEQAMQVLAQDAYAVTMRAQAMGESPAKFAYNMAKQLGFTAKQAANIETIAAGQQVAKSVSGGAQPVSEGSLPQNLAEMSDSDFEVLFKRMAKS